MASLKDIRSRIVSVRSTRKITSAMKVVSAAKFHKAQEVQARYMRYYQAYTYSLALAMQQRGDYAHPLSQAHAPEAPVALVVFSSNTALCGAYNANITKLVLETLQRYPTATIHCVGRKAADALRRAGVHIASVDTHLGDRPSMAGISQLYEPLRDAFLEGRYSKVCLIYNRFVNAAVQQPIESVLLPIEPTFEEIVDRRSEYIFEPTAEEFFAFALPFYAQMNLYAALMSSYVGEHGARMTAMTQATDNANDLIDSLTLEYNKMRQASITSEILEIVSGAEALKSV